MYAEYSRPADKPLPDRYPCHCYDVAMMAKGPIETEALADLRLLAQIVRQEASILSVWADYDRARPEKLTPWACRTP